MLRDDVFGHALTLKAHPDLATQSESEFSENPPHSPSRPTSREPLGAKAREGVFHYFRWLSPRYSRRLWIQF